MPSSKGIFQTRGSNPRFLWLLHCRQILYHWATGEAQSESESCSVLSDSLQHHGLYSPWNSPGQHTGMVALLFSRGSSQPRDWTQVSRVAGRFFTSWATRGDGLISPLFLKAILLDKNSGQITFSLEFQDISPLFYTPHGFWWEI